MSTPSPSSTPFFVRRPLGVLEINGATRLDLIDRLSTQKVKSLTAGEGAATIFTTEIGRIIDRLLVYAAEDRVVAVTGENFGDSMARYLLSYVFFNDDFHLEDKSSQTAVFALYGEAAPAVLAQLGEETAADLPLHHWRSTTIAGQPITLHRTDPIDGDGYLLLVPAAEAAAVEAALGDAGARQLTPAEYDMVRIKAGQPRLGQELTNSYIPLEAGLWDDVSFNKGCYVGQEIIARMESRGKLAKRLVQLAAAKPLEAGTTIKADGRDVGSITSSAGKTALGYVKTTALDKGLPLTADEIVVTVTK